MNRFTLYCLAACTCLFWACSEPDERPFSAGATYVFSAGSSLVYQDKGGAEGLDDDRSTVLGLLDASAEKIKPSLQEVHLPGPLRAHQRRVGDRKGQLLLVDGVDDEGKAETQMVVLGAKGVESTVGLGGVFESMQQSADGRTVAAYGLDSRQSLLNVLQLVTVDIAEGAAELASSRALSTISDSTFEVFVAPAMVVDGEEAHVLVVTAQGMLSLVDLDHPERREVSVDLEDLSFHLGGVDFLEFDAGSGRMYAKYRNAADLLVIDLIRNAQGDGIKPVLSTLPLPINANRLHLYDTVDGPRLLLFAEGANRSGAVIVDPATRRVTQVGFLGEWVVPFELNTGDDAGAYVLVAGDSGIAMVRLRDAERFTATAARDKLFGAFTVAAGTLHVEAGVVVLTEQGGGIAIVDLQQRSVTARAGQLTLTDVVVDAKASRVWLASRGQTALAYVDLKTQGAGELELADEVSAVVSVLASERLVIVHDSPWGHVSVLGTADTSQRGVIGLVGFLVEHIVE